MFRNSSSVQKFTAIEFVEKMEDKSIKTLDVAEHTTVVELKGTYVTSESSKTKSYELTIPKTFYEQVTYTFDSNPDKMTISQIISYRDENKVNENEFSFTTTNVYQVSWWDEWGPSIITLGGSVILCFFLFSRLANSVGASNNKAMDFNQSRAKKIKDSKVRFTDVAGADEEKAELQEIVSYLKEPQKFTKFGAKLPKGILLVGHPGCGKTLLAKAVAGEAGVPFFSISGSDFVEMFVGVGAGRVRDMFKNAKECAPCLVFIDEIDAVGRQRGTGLGGGNDEREQTLNQLLVEMDGFNDNAGIIVMAATNRDDVLDPALLRAGRFDRKITVSLPDKKGREEIFKVHARNKVVSPEVDYGQLAKRTVGFSGADIENIMNEAAVLAVRRQKDCIGIDEIDEAIDRRVAGPAKSSRSISAHEKEIIAYHEAGHAIIGLKYPHSDKVQKITIIPRGNTGGHVRMTPEEDRFIYTKNELVARIVGFLGGRTSEEIFFDDVSSGAENDIEQATYIARLMVTELGMSPLGPIQYERNTGSVFLGRDYTNSQKNFSTETATKIDEEIRKIIEDAHVEATKCIKENKDAVILLAKTLIEHEQITAEEIDYLLENGHLKRDEVKQAEEVKPVEEKQETPEASSAEANKVSEEK
ncbi:MAG: ATP-dependent zinc metalloprotease FtsH [Bacilli bacterium]|nr:ATP-dependent zinc metalloprotease FtsH [Bacilli bacterium]